MSVEAKAETALPTQPCSVVWSRGNAYVLEWLDNGARWIGADDHGRPQALTGRELQRRGWSLAR